MPACPRHEIVADDEVGVYHCYNRCVRRAFLCGTDPVSGKDFEHRKLWIEERAALLAGSFALDVCDFAVMDNHIHLILRTRPDIARSWSDEEVARRWWQVCPLRKDESGAAAEPLPGELNLWLSDPEQMLELRRRLGSISWFMRLLCQQIARRANSEDGVQGKFWESRFKSQALLDDPAILSCSLYVNLNPIRAGKASTPEESEHTSAYERIAALKGRRTNDNGQAESEAACLSSPAHLELELWLSPVELDARSSMAVVTGPGDGNPFPSRRLSNKGFLPMTLEDYLRLLDWTGRQTRPDKPGAIPADLAPILDRLGIKASAWPETVNKFTSSFGPFAGRPESLARKATRLGRHWLRGVRQAAATFN